MENILTYRLHAWSLIQHNTSLLKMINKEEAAGGGGGSHKHNKQTEKEQTVTERDQQEQKGGGGGGGGGGLDSLSQTFYQTATRQHLNLLPTQFQCSMKSPSKFPKSKFKGWLSKFPAATPIW